MTMTLTDHGIAQPLHPGIKRIHHRCAIDHRGIQTGMVQDMPQHARDGRFAAGAADSDTVPALQKRCQNFGPFFNRDVLCLRGLHIRNARLNSG